MHSRRSDESFGFEMLFFNCLGDFISFRFRLEQGRWRGAVMASQADLRRLREGLEELKSQHKEAGTWPCALNLLHWFPQVPQSFNLKAGACIRQQGTRTTLRSESQQRLNHPGRQAQGRSCRTGSDCEQSQVASRQASLRAEQRPRRHPRLLPRQPGLL